MNHINLHLILLHLIINLKKGETPRLRETPRSGEIQG